MFARNGFSSTRATDRDDFADLSGERQVENNLPNAEEGSE
jgi:hypothetical protein